MKLDSVYMQCEKWMEWKRERKKRAKMKMGKISLLFFCTPPTPMTQEGFSSHSPRIWFNSFHFLFIFFGFVLEFIYDLIPLSRRHAFCMMMHCHDSRMSWKKNHFWKCKFLFPFIFHVNNKLSSRFCCEWCGVHTDGSKGPANLTLLSPTATLSAGRLLCCLLCG